MMYHYLHASGVASESVHVFKKNDEMCVDITRVTISIVLFKINSAVWEKLLSCWAEDQNLRSPT